MSANRIDPTSYADWIVVGWSGFAIVCLYLVDLFCWYYKKNSIVSVKNRPLLFVTSIFGTIHIVGTLIANDHIEALREIRAFNCPLWTFWIQHVLGTAPWVAVQVCRLLIYANIYNIINFPRWRKTWLFGISFSLIIAPTLALSSLVTAFKGSVYNAEVGTCVTSSLWKNILICWMACLLILLYLVVRKIGVQIRNEYLNDYRKMTDILVIGTACFVAYGIINLYFGFGHSQWRSIATALIGFIHVFSKVRLTFGALWSSFRYGGRYNDLMAMELQPVRHQMEQISHLSDLEVDSLLWTEFKAYCASQVEYDSERMGLYQFKRGVQAEKPARTVEYIEMLERWNSHSLLHQYGKDAEYYTIIDFCVKNTSFVLPDDLVQIYVSADARNNGGFLHAMDESEFIPLVSEFTHVGRETFRPLEDFYKKLIAHIFFQDFYENELEAILDAHWRECNKNSVYSRLQCEGLVAASTKQSTMPMRIRYPQEAPSAAAEDDDDVSTRNVSYQIALIRPEMIPPETPADATDSEEEDAIDSERQRKIDLEDQQWLENIKKWGSHTKDDEPFESLRETHSE